MRCILLSRTAILQHDELGRLRRALRDSEQRAHAEFFHVLAVEHPAAQIMVLGHLLRGFGQMGRGAMVGRQIGQFARQPHSGRDGHGAIERSLCGIERSRAAKRGEMHRVQLELILGIDGFGRIEAIERLGKERRHQFRQGIESVGRHEVGLRRGRALERVGRGLHRLFPIAQLGLCGQTDQQQAARGDAIGPIQQQAAAGFGLEVAIDRQLRDQIVERIRIIKAAAAASLGDEHHQDIGLCL
ncbi:hypothetical protein GALL_470550 [mine drainage metagenome]|uniref:Uncharacterized protein n=1 Tax=mine drainage metagenome TaxID=410659 RepID=A0A1J5Q1G8_9ZZZZ